MDENNAQGSEFPMRINKYLAREGKGSRREMDKVIALGKVFINGQVAVLGSKVNEGDKVEVRFRGNIERKTGNDMAKARFRRKQKGK